MTGEQKTIVLVLFGVLLALTTSIVSCHIASVKLVESCKDACPDGFDTTGPGMGCRCGDR